MKADRRFWQAVQKWGGVYVPLACLLSLSWSGDPQAGAKVAGAESLLVILVTSFRLANPHLPRVSMVPGLLASVSPAIGLLVFGYGGSWIEAVAVGSTVLAAAYVAILRRDMVAAVTVALCWVTVWTFLLVGIFDNWRTASIWGGGVAVFAALVFAVGRLAQGYGLRSVFVAVACAGPPLGLAAWGISVDWKLAILVALLPTVAGVGGLILTHDYTNDEP